MEARLVIANCASEDEARIIGRKLVESRLAASVNIVPGLQAFYRWEEAVHDTTEVQLIAKTTLERVADAIGFIRKHHSYEQPGILSLKVDGGDEGYLAWITASTAVE